MRASHSVGLVLLVLAGSAACAADDGGGNGGTPVTLSGTVRDYYTDAGVAGVLLAAGGQVGTTNSDGAGAYTFTSVPRNSSISVTAALTNYSNTRNEGVPVANVDATADLFIVANADLARQFAAVGRNRNPGTSIVIVELEDDGGQPREGIPVGNITLRDIGDDPVGEGPYVFGAAGDIVPAATLAQTTAFNGRSRIAFLNVPAGRTTLRVEVPAPAAETLTLPLSGSADGVTLGRR